MNTFQKIISMCVCIVFSTSLNAMFVNSCISRGSSAAVHRRTFLGGGNTDSRWQKQQDDRYRKELQDAYSAQLIEYRKRLKAAKTNEEKECLEQQINTVYRDINFMDRLNGK